MSEIIEIVDPTDALIEEMSTMLSDSDKKAFDRFGYPNAAEGIKTELKMGNVAFICLVNGKPAAALCVKPTLDSFAQPKGYVWLLATSQLKTAPVAVLRKSVYHINKLLQTFHVLVSGIDMTNPTNIQYAEFLGFKNTHEVNEMNGTPYAIYRKDRE